MSSTLHSIAIDFGTSRTKVAYWDPALGRAELLRHPSGEFFLPSLVWLPATGDPPVWGAAAEEMLEDEPAGVIDVLKRHLRKPTVWAARRKEAPGALLAALFSELRHQVGAEVPCFAGALPERVVLTRPALFGPYEEKVLTDAARAAGFAQVDLIAEPVAAATAWLRATGNAAQEVVVFDGGGGTIDWAWLRRDGGRFRVVVDHPPGGWLVGGHDVDEELFARLKHKAGPEMAAAIEDNRLHVLRAVRLWKERLARRLPLTPVRLQGRALALDAGEVAAAVAEVFTAHVVANLQPYMAKVAAARGGAAPEVLLVGGASRLPGLAAALEQHCGCRVVAWDRADYAIVLGAVEAAVAAAAPAAADAGRPPPATPPRPAVRGSGYPVEVGQSFWDIPEGPEMMVIPAGKFVMGSPVGEEGRREAEGPQHEVVVKAPLAVGRYAVTVGEYRTFVEATGRKHEGGARLWDAQEFKWKDDPARDWRSPGFQQDDGHPVVCVNWHDAKAYADWLSQRTGKGYRLLTEAEWEYACRAGTTTPFSFGATITPAQANYNGNYTYGDGSKGPYRQRTVAVGLLPANTWGLHEMHSNVFEWVEDAWRDSYARAPTDASVAVTGAADAPRVLRGGSWSNLPQCLRSAFRDWFAPGIRSNDSGIRLARTPGG